MAERTLFLEGDNPDDIASANIVSGRRYSYIELDNEIEEDRGYL